MPNIIERRALNTHHFFDSKIYLLLIKINKKFNLVDATEAGVGIIEITVNGGTIENRSWQVAPRQYKAMFTPTEPINYTIEMKFNDEHVLNSPWHLPFCELDSLLSTPIVSSIDEIVMTTENEWLKLICFLYF